MPLLFSACNSARFLTPEQTVLSDVKVVSDEEGFKTGAYRSIVRQEPNTKWFNLVKVPLGIYCISSADSSKAKRWNAMLQRIGEAPVVYDSTLTHYSLRSLQDAMHAKGYLHAEVDATTERKRHKTRLCYTLRPGTRYYIDTLAYHFDSPTMRRVVMADSSLIRLNVGAPLDLSALSSVRDGIIKRLRGKGYYGIHKEFITFRVDTLAGDNSASVTLQFAAPAGIDTLSAYRPLRFKRVTVHESASGLTAETDSAKGGDFNKLTFSYAGERPKLWRSTYAAHISTRPDSLFSDADVQNTYGSLNALPAVSYTSIRLTEHPADSTIDANITIHHTKPHTIGAEIEGTNTAGDLGVAVALTYANRNLFRGSEMLSFKVRGAYEAIKGLEGYNNDNYVEWSGELGLNFPTLLAPGVSRSKKRRLKASSTAGVLFDSQNRPEFHRRVLTGSWAYKWTPIARPRLRHGFDLFSLNYVYMPYISDTFRKEYLEGDDPHYSVLRYSYTNLFIMRSAYNFSYNTLRTDAPGGLYRTNGLHIKAGIEIAGNLLYGLSKLTKATPGADGYYNFLGIAYSQYAKFDFDISKSYVINERNSIAFHFNFGIAHPYGNSAILPYEKRYFAGGANSVRGWSVRTLGPGSFKGQDGKIDFINHTGNIKLESSVELRTNLFWKLHGALFIDAGNIWNTRDYPDQPGGLFRFNTFYKQIAVAYGLGLRLNFDYFIIRLDGGMKAINPSYTTTREHFPIIHPSWNRDFTFHFAVGLPF